MASKFDAYLNKGGYSEQDKEALRQVELQEKNASSPNQPKLNEMTAERIENIQATDAGNNYLTKKDNLAKYPPRDEMAKDTEAGKEPEPENER
jgi:hypothetical protein